MANLIEKSKPYVAMIFLQFGYAGMDIISKVSLNRGMNHFVLVVYRHVVATVVLAPFAFFFERKVRPKLTFSIFWQIFVLGLLGPVMDQNFYYLGLKLTSPTFAVALSNILPAVTFVIALLFKMERVNLKKLRSQAKIVGTIVCFGGATLMTIYKGPLVHMVWSPHQSHKHNQTSASRTSAAAVPDNKERIIGAVLIVAATLSWSALFILQAAVLKKYSAELSLATLICFLGTLQATVLSVVFIRDPSSQWAIGWNINLLTAIYSGVMASAVAYYLQGLCMQVKGPVFATAFSPLEMIIVAIMASIILSENVFLGSVLGGVLIVIGIYAVLWGKVKDSQISTNQIRLEVLPKSQLLLSTNQNNMDEIEVACTGLQTHQFKSQLLLSTNQNNMDEIEIACTGLQTHQFNAGDKAISITRNNNPEM